MPRNGRPNHHQGHKHGPRHREAREDGPLLIFGAHAIEAALANPARTILKLYLTDNAENRLRPALAARKVQVERVNPRDLDRRLGVDTVHQGVLAEALPMPEPSLDTLAEATQEGRPLVILDQVTDPHNVGAILRSAAVFGAAGLVMTRRHSPPLAGALAKSASGALEVVPITLVTNLARALAELRDFGLILVGLDGEADSRLEENPWESRTGLVLGAEGKGLRQLTRENCDRLCRVAADGPLSSLNVSNAAAVALHFGAIRRLGL